MDIDPIHSRRLLYPAGRLPLHQTGKEPSTPLVKGQFEGWARVRIAGQTDWQHLWIIITTGSAQTHGTSGPDTKKGRLSGLFRRLSYQYIGSNGPIGRNTPSKANPNSSSTDINDPPTIYFYRSGKSKERKTPILSVSSVSQAVAVYPERPDLITRSTLLKIEGRLGKEEGAGAIKGTEAWVLIMPEVESGQTAGPRKTLEWVIALHDAFRLYGRPMQYSFDPHNRDSLMFGCPADPSIDQLFLDRELAESLDPREDATSITRSRLTTILQEHIRCPPKRTSSNESPLFIQSTRVDQPIGKNATQHSAQDQSDITTPIVFGLDPQLAIGARRLDPTPPIQPNTTEKCSSPSDWMDQQQQVNVSTAGGGSGARPVSMTFGTRNVEGPAPTGANLTAQKDVTTPEATQTTLSPTYLQSTLMTLSDADMGFSGPFEQHNQPASAAAHEPLIPQLLYARPSTLHSPYALPDLLTGSPPPPAMIASQSQTNPVPAAGLSYNGIPISPMMMNPMMTGMGGIPNTGMMGGFSPQQQFHMWIAQQVAAEAYQRTMVELSQAGLVGSGQQQVNGREASPMSGQWNMMGMGIPWMGMNPMMTGGGMGMMSPWFGGSQFVGGMGMQGVSGMGPINSSFGFQGDGQSQGNLPAPVQDSQYTLAQNGGPAAGASSQQ